SSVAGAFAAIYLQLQALLAIWIIGGSMLRWGQPSLDLRVGPFTLWQVNAGFPGVELGTASFLLAVLAGLAVGLVVGTARGLGAARRHRLQPARMSAASTQGGVHRQSEQVEEWRPSTGSVVSWTLAAAP